MATGKLLQIYKYYEREEIDSLSLDRWIKNQDKPERQRRKDKTVAWD